MDIEIHHFTFVIKIINDNLETHSAINNSAFPRRIKLKFTNCVCNRCGEIFTSLRGYIII